MSRPATLLYYAILLGAVCTCAPLRAAPSDELRVKRQQVFEFTRKPTIVRRGDRIGISFTSKGYCDVTIAVQRANGAIVRHLASGVLGKNAPPPLQRASLAQTVLWDGKDDQARYIDEKDELTIRVSLGLRPQFERSLLWSPQRRTSTRCPLIRTAPEGIYICEGQNLDSLRLYDHAGNYLRTIYPFPADKARTIKDLHWYTFPHDGARLPLKEGFWQTTLLSSGDNAGFHQRVNLGYGKHIGYSDDGYAVSTFAVHPPDRPARPGHIALVRLHLNRIGSDGGSCGLPLKGPETGIMKTSRQIKWGREPFRVYPWASAFSPDGNTLYLSGYAFRVRRHWDCLHGVMKLDFAKNDPPQAWIGGLGYEDYGTDNRHFKCAADVACDPKGRVYVADHMNDRVQIFAPDGTFLKSLHVFRPAMLSIHHQTGELFVFTWVVHNRHTEKLAAARQKAHKPYVQIVPRLTHFGPFEDPKQKAAIPLPLPVFGGRQRSGTSVRSGPLWSGAVDSWTDPPTVWIGRMFASRIGHSGMTSTSAAHRAKTAFSLETATGGRRGIRLYTLKGDELALKRDFGREAVRAVVNDRPPLRARQRMYVNPTDGSLLVGECDSGVINQGFQKPLRVDPETGKVTACPLPFTCEDFAFDINGLAYLRGFHEIVRYNSRTWREVPFDYGEVRKAVSFAGSRAPAVSALVLPTHVTLWHRPGFGVSPTGRIAVGCYATPKELYKNYSTGTLRSEDGSDRTGYGSLSGSGRRWQPAVYPGRLLGKKGTSIHVWDRHGKLVHEDVAPGLAAANGVQIDADDNVYVLASMYRRFDGERHFNDMTGTVMKFAPGKNKLRGTVKGPVPLTDVPKRPAELGKGGLRLWTEGARWFYGGIGFCGQGVGRPGAMAAGGCSCWNCRFTLDYFRRSFAPEMDHYSVAIIDTNGNLITRVGTYGNVDDGQPAEKPAAPAEPPHQRAIGGDEVALFYAPYLATHTDHRLFIADPGNGRIVSVKLGYHATEQVALKNIPEEKN